MTVLNSKRLILRSIESKDINQTYLNWLNDPNVNQFLETRFFPQSIESIQSYWHNHRDDKHSPWLAITLRDNKKHIGNIKIGPIQWVHRSADISIFIGEQDCWGKGYATEAIALIRDWSFNELDLQKLNSGIYSGNIGSRRAFEKCGFKLEGTLQDEVYCNGGRLDVWRMGLTRNDWRLFS